MFDKQWNVFPLQENTKLPAEKWDRYKTEMYPRDQLPANGGHNFAVVCGDISGGLLKIDIDCKDKEAGYEVIRQFLTKYPTFVTRIVSTPHGWHLDFKMKGFTQNRQVNKNILTKHVTKKNKDVFVGVFKTHFSDLVDGIDFLGNNGYAVIPPSKIDDMEYEYYNNFPVRAITAEEFEVIREFFILDKPRKMRKPFVEILNGEVEIESYAAQNNQSEFLYWKFLFREAWHRLGLEPRELYPLLKRNQPAFDEGKTEQQVNSSNGPKAGQPLTNEKLAQMFPHAYITDTKEKVLPPLPQIRPRAGDLMSVEDFVPVINTFNPATSSREIRNLMVQVPAGDPMLVEQVITAMTVRTRISKAVLRKTYNTLFEDREQDIIDQLLIEIQFKFDTAQGRLYYWDGHRWNPEGRKAMNVRFQELYQDIFEKRPTKKEYGDACMNISNVRNVSEERVNWNDNTSVIPFRNCYYDTIEDVVFPPDPGLLFTYYIKCDLDMEAKCPKFMAFFEAAVPMKSRNTVQCFAGYTLLPSTHLKKCLFLVGPPNSGKSTLINIIRFTIGRDFAAEVNPTKLDAENHLGILEGCVMGFYHDLAGGTLRKIDVFKIIIDSIDFTFEEKWVKRHRANFFAHFWFAGNVLPKYPLNEGAESVAAFLERTMIVYLNNEFYGKKREISRKIVEEERAGILAWMVRGLKSLLKDGDFKYTRSTTELDWLANTNSVAKWFKENFVFSTVPTDRFGVEFLFEECNKWLHAHNIMQIDTIQNFGKEAKVLNLPKQRIDKTNFYAGLQWRSDVKRPRDEKQQTLN